MSRRSARHAARRAQRRAAAPARMLKAALGTAGVIVLGILAGGGTYAAWSVSAPAAAATTLQAGSAGLQVTDPGLTASGLYPGRAAHGATDVRNTGTVPLALAFQATTSAAPNAFTTALRVTVAPLSASGRCDAAVTPMITVAVGAAPASAGTLAPGATQRVCLGLTLPADAPAAAAGAAASTLTLTVSGTQVQP
ncbi:hypothetical protein [Microbacterium jiangjiandongii]|uniref:hypothetical protein n=1 Tax=Microbacterium jiangjiandongii TaxID=3049071 RepID=UPI00214B51F5|nr:hypothetical protein [Microbacterium sp. zg.Y843]MCR2815519.1 hypothetical protein [Microbacterium sp. zg.Y843]